MLRRIRSSKVLIVGAILAATLVVGGVAFGLWSATATGSATAAARTAVSVTVAASTGTADLYPGFTQGDLTFTLNNPNPYPITFTSMTTPGSAISSNPTACANVNVAAVGKTGLSLVVAANTTSAPLTITDVVSMISAAPDGCQGLTFAIALTLTGAQTS